MAFQPGTSGNPAGRPRGAKDKAGKAAKETALAFIGEYFTQGQALKDWKRMKPYERWNIICRLLSIVIPKETNQKINLAGMPPEDAARLVLEAAGLLEEEE